MLKMLFSIECVGIIALMHRSNSKSAIKSAFISKKLFRQNLVSLKVDVDGFKFNYNDTFESLFKNFTVIFFI